MTEAKKDLAYYLAHTDEMPTDPKQIEELANEHMQVAMEKGSEDLTVERFVKPEDKLDVTSAEPKAGEEKPAAEPKVAAKEEKPKPEEQPKVDGVLAKDGKNVIPFAVLESARERAAEAEKLAAEQAKEIERLKGAKPSGEKPAAEKPETEMLTEEELSALEADSPTLAKVLRGQQKLIVSLNETVQSIAKSREAEAEAEKADVKSEIQSAIDATPTLATWQAAADQTMWNEAAKFDRLLRENPKYADVPFEERFAKVVELTQAALGLEVEKAAPKEEPKLTQEDIKAAAEAKLKAKAPLPKSLSDIPGGAPPAVDERQKVEQMSPTALGQAFLGMTKDQMDAYLSSL